MAHCTYLVGHELYISLTNRSLTTTLLASRGPGFPFAANFVPLPPGYEPTAEEISCAVRHASGNPQYNVWDRVSITYAGLGDPLEARNVLFNSARILNRDGYRLRMVTAGQVPDPSAVASSLVGLIDMVTVGVNAHNEATYATIMRPPPLFSLATSLKFCQACHDAGIRVEATCVEHPLVDVDACERLTRAHGAISFRRRSYFP